MKSGERLDWTGTARAKPKTASKTMTVDLQLTTALKTENALKTLVSVRFFPKLCFAVRMEGLYGGGNSAVQ